MDAIHYERFMAKIEPEPNSGCWLWVGARDSCGYGNFAIHRRTRSAHRVSYEHYAGEIAVGLTVDHLCRMPACVNPAHLEAVTFQENVSRGVTNATAVNRRKTHCPQGHTYDKVYMMPLKGVRRPARMCTACIRTRDARRVQGVAS